MRLTSSLLVLAIDYHEMFKGLLEKVPKVKPAVDQEIAWAKQHLHKSERIIWWLRQVRLKIIQQQEAAGILPSGILRKELDAYNKKAGPDNAIGGGDIIKDEWRFKRDMEHYMSVEDQGIQSVIFGWRTPLNLMDTLKEADDVYKAKAKEDERMLAPQEGDEVFIKFGNGWAWWALSRGYCSAEAKAMGHCGNQGQVTGDQIISLREPRKKGGQSYWEPHLTFIFDKESGMLGEMKGRGNEKPAPRYHPYIISLLKDARIKGIKGGGYAPDRNFAMSDLPEDEQTALEAEKPELMTLRRMLKKEGIEKTYDVLRKGNKFSDAVVNKTMALLGIKKESFDPGQGGFRVHTWDDLPEFVEERGDRTAKWIMEVDQGNEYLNTEHGYSKSDMRDLISSLPKNVIHNIGMTLEVNHPDELLEFIEQEGGEDEFTWEPDQRGDVEQFLEYLDEQGVETEVDEALERAHSDAVQSGAEGAMHKALLRAVEEASDSSESITMAHEGTGWWDGKIYAILRLPDAVEAAATCEEGDGCSPDPDENPYIEEIINDIEVKVGEHNDFSDFDDKYAVERMSEEFSTPPAGYNAKKPVEGQNELFPEVFEEPAATPVEEEDATPANAEMLRPGLSFGTKGVTH